MHVAVIVLGILFLAAPFVLGAAAWRGYNRTRLLQSEVDRLTREAAQFRLDLRQRTELDTVKDEFISTVSHELRTPLTSIRGALGLLTAGSMTKLDERSAKLLRIASSNTDRLVRLINDILDLQRMESGNAPISLRPCSLRELILQALDTMGAMAEATGVRLESSATANGRTVVFEGDPDRLQQVLTNLLSNAIKFSPAGASVRVSSAVTANDITVRVEDSGRGVPSDQLESIFGRFNQVEPSDSRQKGGTGLGLAICRSIVQQHGGEIWAERNDTREAGIPGMTFVLQLPRHLLPDTLAAPDTAPAGAILIVDEDAGVRHVVAEHVRHHGYTVLEADSGQNALAAADPSRIEAMLLGLSTPGLSGWQTLERLKCDPATAGIPVVVFSVLSPDSSSTSWPRSAPSQTWMQRSHNPSSLLAELGRVLHRGDGPARILLVEDDPDLATMVLSSFEDQLGEELRLDRAATLHQAILACETHPPEVLLLDLSLPDGTGFALVKWLRRQPNLRTLPLVVYSGQEVTPDDREQLRLGSSEFLARAQVQPKEIQDLVLAMVRQLQQPVAG